MLKFREGGSLYGNPMGNNDFSNFYNLLRIVNFGSSGVLGC